MTVSSRFKWVLAVVAGVAILGAGLGLHPWRRPAPGAAAATGAAGHNRLQAVTDEYDLAYGTNHTWLTLKPSLFLVATVTAAGPPPADVTALDIGSGNGRNVLYLAQKGYRVTGVDLSKVGLDTTRQLATLYRLPVTTVAQDINAFNMGRARWDLITLIDFPFAYRKLLPRIAAGLKPGGLVVIEDVSAKQGTMESPDHSLHYTLMQRRDLNAPFAGFTVLHDSERHQDTMWGARAIMIRFSARKAAR